jgi:putative ABC transport system substrate-binding protein
MGRYVVWGTELLTVLLVVLTALALPRVAAAQRPGPVPRIGFVDLNFPPSASAPTPFLEAFRHALRAHGWVEGHTIAIEWRWAEGSNERFATLVAELVRLPVEVLVVPNATTAQIAKEVTTTIPMVVVGAGSLVEMGLVVSLARPGGNITGVTTLAPELTTKRLELLKEALPKVTRVAVLRGLASYKDIFPALEVAARALGVELHFFDVREPAAFDGAFAAMTRAQVHALFVLGDPFFGPYNQRIADLALQHHLPSSCTGRRFVEAGCLMSYAASAQGREQQIAAYVDKILHGAKPADLPVEQATKFELAINLKTAQALGITIPPIILFQADKVIQ